MGPDMSALTITNQGAIRTITLSRPDVRNAFNDEVIAELKNAFTEAGLAADVRCVVPVSYTHLTLPTKRIV